MDTILNGQGNPEADTPASRIVRRTTRSKNKWMRSRTSLMKRGEVGISAKDCQTRQYPCEYQCPDACCTSAPSPIIQVLTTAPTMDQVYIPALTTDYPGMPSGASTTRQRANPPTPSYCPNRQPILLPPARYHCDERYCGQGGGNST